MPHALPPPYSLSKNGSSGSKAKKTKQRIMKKPAASAALKKPACKKWATTDVWIGGYKRTLHFFGQILFLRAWSWNNINQKQKRCARWNHATLSFFNQNVFQNYFKHRSGVSAETMQPCHFLTRTFFQNYFKHRSGVTANTMQPCDLFDQNFFHNCLKHRSGVTANTMQPSERFFTTVFFLETFETKKPCASWAL